MGFIQRNMKVLAPSARFFFDFRHFRSVFAPKTFGTSMIPADKGHLFRLSHCGDCCGDTRLSDMGGLQN